MNFSNLLAFDDYFFKQSYQTNDLIYDNQHKDKETPKYRCAIVEDFTAFSRAPSKSSQSYLPPS